MPPLLAIVPFNLPWGIACLDTWVISGFKLFLTKTIRNIYHCEMNRESTLTKPLQCRNFSIAASAWLWLTTSYAVMLSMSESLISISLKKWFGLSSNMFVFSFFYPIFQVIVDIFKLRRVKRWTNSAHSTFSNLTKYWSRKTLEKISLTLLALKVPFVVIVMARLSSMDNSWHNIFLLLNSASIGIFTSLSIYLFNIWNYTGLLMSILP